MNKLKYKIVDLACFFLSRLFYYLFSSLNSKIRSDMRWVFFGSKRLDGKEKRWLEDKIKKHYHILLYTLIDIFFLYFKGRPFFTYKLQDKRHFEKLLEEEKSFFLLLGHFGNWEYLGWWLGRVAQVNIGSFYLDQYLRLIDKFLYNLRKKNNIKLFHRLKEIKKAIYHIQKGGILAFISDQDGLEEGEYLYFFDRLVSAPPGVVKLAHKYQRKVLPVFTYYDLEENTFYIRFFESFFPQNIGQIYQKLEEMVLLYPEQWLWLYGRWKRRRHVLKYAYIHQLPLFRERKGVKNYENRISSV